MKATLVFFILFYTKTIYGQIEPLFRIEQNDKIGYINKDGNIIIQPVYLSGNNFSEGLAAVRENGLYGFIDASGKFRIKPQYDFATHFLKGIALVYKDAKPYFIDNQGNIVLPTIYKSITFIGDRIAIVTTTTNKEGVLDIVSKKLLIDTMFSTIGDFRHGVAVVGEYVSPKKKNKSRRVGIVDTTGKFIVPFGKFKTINSFIEGYAIVEITDPKNKAETATGVIDMKGNLIFKRPYFDNSYVDGDFHDGYARISLYKYWLPDKEGILFTLDKNYEGYINLQGEVVFNDTNYRYVKDFSNGRAFVRKEDEDFILIDKNFKRVGNGTFQDVVNGSFKDGYAIVETKEGYGIIDTTGNFLVRPRVEEIDRFGIVDGYFFFAIDGEYDNKLYGVSDLNGTVIIKPIISEFDRNGFINGLLKAFVKGRLSYIDKRGQIVWQQQEESSGKLKPLNIDYMNRGYFYAYSSPGNPDTDHSGGWATSDNKPKRISEIQLPENSLSVTIDTTKIDTFANKYLGYQLLISNSTADIIKFDAQDSRLYMKLQAQNAKGEWKDIEYLPSSWCGNSYHTIELEPGAFWNITIPNYHGEFKTKIRAELRVINKKDPKNNKFVYSNVIEGSVNPGQFWKKRSYLPSGLMDPYFD